MRHPFRRVYLWTLIILSVQCVAFYLFRNRLTQAFIASAVPPFPADWHYNELVPAVLWLFASFNTWIFSKAYGWRHKSKPDQAIKEIIPLIDSLSTNISTLNENVWNLFRTFNPLIEQYGVRWEIDEMKLIQLREIAHTVDVKAKLLQEKRRELDDLEKAQVTA